MTPTAAASSRWRLAPPWRWGAARGANAPVATSEVADRALRSQARVGRWVFSLALLLLLATLVCAGGLYQQASRRDARRETEHRAALQAGIDAFRRAFAELTVSRAKELAANAVPDGDALEARLAPAASADLRPEQAYVIGAGRQVIASFPRRHATPPVEIERLIAHFMEAPSGPVMTDFVLVDEVPALLAVTGLPAAAGGEGSGRILAAVRRLDPSLMQVFERTVGVKELASEAGQPGEGRAVLVLIGDGGRIVGWLGWDRDRPMTEALLALVPLALLIAAGLIGFVRVAVRQMGQTTRDLAASETNVWRLAHEDTLTGLPNHRKMLDVLARALAQRTGDQVVTFAYLDLDGFKEINDSLGHAGGDQLLAAIAERLRGILPPHATAGRFGGDEFALVMTSPTHEDGLAAVRLVLAAVNKPYRLDSGTVDVGGSIGVAQAPRDGRHRDELSHRADLALREAKRTGRGQLVRFAAAMDRQFEEQRFLKRELQHALAAGTMHVHYQPIVAADGARLIGVEALLRWTHPTRGEIPPSIFIPVAEQGGMMDELGAFVLERALGDARRWPDLYIAVNLSPVQVRDRAIAERVAATLRRTGIEPARVVLEITEGVLMENPEEAKQRLEDLRALGVRIALDDFGSGYSSLSYLQRFPFDKLKIDKAFVDALSGAGNGGVIMHAIVALGRALGVTVLVEGVETEEQRVLLRLAGCDEMQGFLFARPAPPDAIDRLWADANLKPAGARHAVRASVS